MKRKRIDKHKVYELIGRATVYVTGFVIAEAMFIASLMYVLENCITTIK